MNTFLDFLDSIEKTPMISCLKSAYLESFHKRNFENYGAGIFFYCPNTKRCFLALRSDDEDDGNVWCSLGGKGEVNETPIQTAIREVTEEGKITPDQYHIVDQPLYTCQNTPDFKFITFLGLVNEEFIPTLNHEHTEFKWVTTNDLSNLNLHFGVRELLKKSNFLNNINSYNDDNK